MTKIQDSSFAVGRGWSRVRTHDTGDAETYNEGTVITPHGFVDVYAQGDDKYLRVSRLDFIWCGRFYTRRFEKTRLTPRGLARAAKKFAAEIAGA